MSDQTIELSETNVLSDWKSKVCGQCEFGKELSPEARLAASPKAPRLLECWNGPPQSLVTPQPNGTFGIMLTRLRLPLDHPACGQFIYSNEANHRSSTPLPPPIIKPKPSLIIPS